MNKLIKILNEILQEDTGATGKDFEKKFIQALELVGLDFEVNRSTGALWDIHPKGPGWNRLLTDEDVNIKIARTKWMFGFSEMSRMLPWDDIDNSFNPDLYKDKIRMFLKKKGVQDNFFLKPKDDAVQAAIIQAVDNQDVNALNKLLISSNFYAEKLGSNYDIRILTKDHYITSIILDKEGRPFIRSERPRNVSGSNFVGFKALSPKLGTATRRLKTR